MKRLTIVGAVVILLPILFLLQQLFIPTTENWATIQTYLLPAYVTQTVVLGASVVLTTVIIGGSLAWLITAYDFPLRRLFSWALLLPLAIPPYIGGFTYSSMLSYTGIVQKTLRNTFGIEIDQRYLDILSLPGAVVMFTLFLMPYVYVITRAFLLRQPGSLFESARLLGRSGVGIWLTVAMPIARPALAGGGALVLYEVLSDYGLTHYFGVQTFTTAIFQTWFGLYDIASAVRLAALLMLGVLGVVVLEKRLRKARYVAVAQPHALVAKRLVGVRGWLAFAACGAVVAVGFLFPVLQQLQWAIWTYADVEWGALLRYAANTVWLAGLAAIVAVVIAMPVANVARERGMVWRLMPKIYGIGYTIPGAIVSIGVLVLFLTLDDGARWWTSVFNAGGTSYVFSLSIFMLGFGYVIRFIGIAIGPIEAGYEKLGSRFTESARMLGATKWRAFTRVELPLLRGAFIGSFTITFVEMVKELPMTLLLRPFNFHTLATRTYQFASDERIQEASIPCLALIGVSLLSVTLLYRLGGEQHERS